MLYAAGAAALQKIVSQESYMRPNVLGIDSLHCVHSYSRETD